MKALWKNIILHHQAAAVACGIRNQRVMKAKDAFVAITFEDSGGIPEMLDEPILVGVYDMETMDIIVDAKRVD